MVHNIPPANASYITGGGLDSFGNIGVLSLCPTGDKGGGGVFLCKGECTGLSVIKLWSRFSTLTRDLSEEMSKYKFLKNSIHGIS